MQPAGKRGFTLPELMIAMAISLMAIASVVSFFWVVQRDMQDATGRFLVARETRLLRENLVRGFSDYGGLRSAIWSNVTVNAGSNVTMLTFWVDTNTFADASAATRIQYGLSTNTDNTGASLWRQGTVLGGIQSSNFTLNSLTFVAGTQSVTAVMTVSCRIGSRGYTNTQTVATWIPNL